VVSGYDTRAQEVWRCAKARALQEVRLLTLEDLWWGVWCVLASEFPSLSLPESVQQELEQLRQSQPEAKVGVDESVRAFHKQVQARCQEQGRSAASPHDMLATLIEMESPSIRALMQQFGMTAEQVRAVMPKPAASPLPASALQALAPYTINLSQLAAEGKLSPAYERDAEREALVLGLLSRTKPNVALVGPAGVGKTKLVEDLALRIHNGEIPQLQGYTVLQLNLTALRAGTSMHGELEQRFERLRQLLEQYGDRIILFIDELHTIVGTQIGGHTLDLANALKPLLTSGRMRCIGATTRQEYVQHIETDRALARRFQVVTLQEPSRETMQRILREVRSLYEQHHGVRYPDETLEVILDLSERFMPTRHYPDKAIDLLDAAGAWVVLHGTPPYTVQPQDVYQVLAKRLQIPVEEMTQATYQNLAAKLGEQVLGQAEALQLIEQAVNESFSTREPSSGVRLAMIFAGPPNVGKTLTARLLALHLCRNEKAFLEIDLRTLVRRYHLSADELDSLIGVKPPYSGWERGGVLTNHVIEFPRCVIYLRGIEQTTPAAQELFRSILEKGYCEDGRGQQVAFREAILIFAYELGAEGERAIGFGRAQRHQPTNDPTRLMRQMEEAGFPETILNLVPILIPFQPLNQETLHQIAQRTLQAACERVYKQFGKVLEYEEPLLAWLLKSEEEEPLQPEDIQRKVEHVLLPAIKNAAIQMGERWHAMQTIRLQLHTDALKVEPPRPRLLVYDDVPDFYQELCNQYPDFEWHYANTEPQALQILAQHRPHIVLIDTCLTAADATDTSGIAVLQSLKARYPEPTYLLVTTQAVSFETTRDAFRAGAYDYLYRPPDESVLRQLAQSLVEREMQQRQLQYQSELLKRHLRLQPTVLTEQGVVQISLLVPDEVG
jgi:ATP-dependent Clp protease ATP-binding subunit ClpA/ActR/RegA family two-component response regulator